MLLASFKERFPVMVSSLLNARRGDRLAHAYLVHGDNHLVREDFAAALAQLLVCRQPGPDGMPCGNCHSCQTIARGVYPELHMLRPSGKMRFIKVGDRVNPDPNTLRWFEDQFYYTADASSPCKIGIIHDADRMNDEAQNAFLKTLEEPPPETYFILTTGNPAALLPTTRSRCQTLMILENRAEFDFSGFDDLLVQLHALTTLAQGKLVAAEKCVEIIILLAGTLKAEAEKRAEEEWSAQLEMAKELEPPARKRIEEQYQAAGVAEYLRLRQYFLAAIHTWFAQLYQLGNGIAPDHLANPEFFAKVGIPQPLPSADAGRLMLQHTDDLLFNLIFNVDEDLALRCWGLNVALKSMPVAAGKR